MRAKEREREREIESWGFVSEWKEWGGGGGYGAVLPFLMTKREGEECTAFTK